ncbi:MAG: chemotaxis protein CheA [Capsulimonadaceae bacterium]|nr:chemotaxis protein CheA [Capsulimonadaceae bacterium]
MGFETNDLAQLFFEESDEFVELMETSLLKVEQDGADTETLNAIFRCAHSIKGGSGSMGFSEVAMFTHGLETLLDNLRNGHVIADDDITALLIECADHLKDLLDAARASKPYPNSSPLMTRLEIIIDGGGPPQEEEFDEDKFRAEIAALLAEEEGKSAEPAKVADFSDLDALMDEPVEAAAVAAPAAAPVAAAPVAPVVETVAAPAPSAAPGPVATASAAEPSKRPAAADKTESQILRISADKVDRLINLVGELVIHQSMLVDAAGTTASPQMAAAVSAISQATRELQERVLAVRMLPVKQLFGRFPRIVRDLGRACGKHCTLETSGEETELDKMVIEGLVDPLTHLIRNSVDHGIETPEDRIAAGKPESGTVWLRARHESGSIILEIVDDGKGLDKEKIVKKAIEKGLASPEDQLSDEAIYAMIYQPGFSTAAVVSDVSGRGVGMDIVVQAIRGLGGAITVTSKLGHGTTFRLKLPLTMAIVEGLTVRVGKELYVLPLTNIVECIKPGADDIHTIAGQGEVLNLRGTVLPVTRLHTVFGVPSDITEYQDGVLVIVEDGAKKAALLVDELVGQNQVVVKSLETNYGNVEAVAGATILGDGKVALIIDVAGLSILRQASAQYAAAA